MHRGTLSCVLLADRHHGLSEGVRGLLDTAFESVVMVANVESLLAAAERLRPDVAVVELSLAQESGLEWLRALRALGPDLGVVVISVHPEVSVRRAAIEAGADAFVVKRVIATDLLPAVERVRRGRSPGVATAPGSDADRGRRRRRGNQDNEGNESNEGSDVT